MPIDSSAAEGRFGAEPAHNMTPERLFERDWALTLLAAVFDALRREYDSQGKLAAFEAIKPVLEGGSGGLRYIEIATRLGITEGAVKVAVHRLRKRYKALLREQIAATVDDQADVDDEIRAAVRRARVSSVGRSGGSTAAWRERDGRCPRSGPVRQPATERAGLPFRPANPVTFKEICFIRIQMVPTLIGTGSARRRARRCPLLPGAPPAAPAARQRPGGPLSALRAPARDGIRRPTRRHVRSRLVSHRPGTGDVGHDRGLRTAGPARGRRVHGGLEPRERVDRYEDEDNLSRPCHLGSSERVRPRSALTDGSSCWARSPRGGMGAVLKGRDTDLGRDLAVKVLLEAHKDQARPGRPVFRGGADHRPAPAPWNRPRL